MKRLASSFLFFGLVLANSVAQTFFEPNFALKSPQTLNIINIELKDDATILNMGIENLIEGGYFCIDPSTYLITDSGEKLVLTDITGLPLCPDTYKFMREGEIKYFTLHFPPISKEIKWIDIIEDCEANCLSIFGLSIDPTLNSEINICFRDIEQGRVTDAIKRFESLKEKLSGSINPILGSVYLNLISLYREMGSEKEAETLISELKESVIPHKQLFIDTLR